MQDISQLGRPNIDELISRAIALLEEGEYDRAIVAYTEAIRLDPINAKAYCSRAAPITTGLLPTGTTAQARRAIADWTEAIRLDPTDAWAYRTRGVVQKNGNLGEAIADFTEAIELHREDTDLNLAYLDRGNAYYEGGEGRQGHRRLYRGCPASTESPT